MPDYLANLGEPPSATAILLGGFFLTRPVVIPKLQRIPANGFLTVSKCLADFVPDDWLYWNPADRKTERSQQAKALGIELLHLDRLSEWCTEQLSEKQTLGYPNVIFDIETARELARQFLRFQSLTLLGIGLRFEMSGKFFEAAQYDKHRSARVPLGVPTLLERGLILPDGGESLGFEALGYEFEGTFHSSKCYSSEDPALSKISFNEFGYCADFSEAIQLCAIRAKQTAKEITWLPWEIRRYVLL